MRTEFLGEVPASVLQCVSRQEIDNLDLLLDRLDSTDPDLLDDFDVVDVEEDGAGPGARPYR